MSSPPVIGLLTDFHTRDWYVAAMKAVILSRCPSAHLIDITHDIPPQDIVSGAFVLAAAVPWFPRGSVVVAVVDPGVGSERALLAAEQDGRFLIGPDNGLLALSLARPFHASPRTFRRRARGARIVRLVPSRVWLAQRSHTFHGRDILAPVAAELARGGALSALGRPAPRIQPLTLPAVRRRGRSGLGQIVYVDTFGNLITNLPGSWLRHRRATLVCRRRVARVVEAYHQGRLGELIALVGSLGLVELAVRDGSAASRMGASRGDGVILTAST